jgi:hypothetical protein
MLSAIHANVLETGAPSNIDPPPVVTGFAVVAGGCDDDSVLCQRRRTCSSLGNVFEAPGNQNVDDIFVMQTDSPEATESGVLCPNTISTRQPADAAAAAVQSLMLQQAQTSVERVLGASNMYPVTSPTLSSFLGLRPLVPPLTALPLNSNQRTRKPPQICSNVGCSIGVQYLTGGLRGVCAKHGGYQLCSLFSCVAPRFLAKGGRYGFCRKHGGIPICTVEGCNQLQSRAIKGLARPGEFMCNQHNTKDRRFLGQLKRVYQPSFYYPCLIDISQQRCTNARQIAGSFSIPTCEFKWHYHNKCNISKQYRRTNWSDQQRSDIENVLTSVITKNKSVFAEFLS